MDGKMTLYDEYVKKTEKRAVNRLKAKRWLVRHRVAIAAAAVAAFAAVLVLMFFSGAYLSRLDPEKSVYGENGYAGTSAFLNTVRYTLTSADGSVLAASAASVGDVPAGDYTVEAKTVNPFGMTRVQEATLSVARRPLTVTPETLSLIYGDEPDPLSSLKTEGLAEGDKIVSCDLVFDRTVGSQSVTAANIRICNRHGDDVTGSYDITANGGSFDILPRPVTVVSGSAEKIFDGAPLRAETVEVTGGIAPWDEPAYVFSHGGFTEPGRYENEFSVSFVHGGEDRTWCYEIDTVPGELAVLPVSLTVSTPDHTKVYDGEIYMPDGFSLDSGELLPDDELGAVYTGFTDAGTYVNKALIVVRNTVSGEDVTRHYDIKQRSGKVTVEKRPVTVTSVDAGPYVYDGETHRFEEASLTGGTLANGHSAEYGDFAAVVHAGKTANKFKARILNSSGGDVTSNYAITYVPGTVTVTKRRVELELYYTIADNTVGMYFCTSTATAGGTSLGVNDFVNADPISYSVKFEHFDEAAVVHIMNFSDTGEHERDGDYDATVKVICDPKELMRQREESDWPDPVPGGENPDAGDEMISGQLPREASKPSDKVAGFILSKRQGQIYLRLKSFGSYGNGYWNGPSQTWSYNWTDSDRYVLPSLFTVHTLEDNGYRYVNTVRVRYYGNDTLVPVPYFAAAEQYTSGEAFHCVDYGVPAFNSPDREYSFKQISGLSLKSLLGLKKTYAGEYDTYAQLIYTEIDPRTGALLAEFLADRGISEMTPDVITKVAELIKKSAVYNMSFKPFPEDADPVIYFLTEGKEGICSHFASAATLAYRALGIPARYTVGYLVSAEDTETGDFFTSRNAHAWVEVYLEGVGWIPVEVTPPSGGDGGSGSADGFEQYDEEKEITYNVISVFFRDRVKEFDGTPLYSEDLTVLNEEILEPGHTVSARSESLTYAGTKHAGAEYVRITDRDGNDVTDRYEIETNYCTLTVKPRVIELEPYVLYVGQSIPWSFLGRIGDEEARKLCGSDTLDSSAAALTNSLLDLGSDGNVRALSVGIAVLKSGFDAGVLPGETFSADEIEISRTVEIVPFENVRISDGPADEEMLKNAGESSAPETVTGENGREYTLLKIASDSAEKEFDCTPLTAAGYTILSGCLKPGHRLEYRSRGLQLYAGESPNNFGTLRITGGSGEDRTGEYIVYFYPGILRVKTGRLAPRTGSISFGVNEMFYLPSVRWENDARNLDLEYTLDGRSGAAALSGDNLIGVSAGKTVLTALLRPVDVNGDGVIDYASGVYDFSVTVNDGRKGSSAAAAVILPVSAAAAGALIFFLMKKAGKDEKK